MVRLSSWNMMGRGAAAVPSSPAFSLPVQQFAIGGLESGCACCLSYVKDSRLHLALCSTWQAAYAHLEPWACKPSHSLQIEAKSHRAGS